ALRCNLRDRHAKSVELGGTRSEEGSRAFALLASVIETCRRRGASAWQYLGTVIAAARKGLQLPALPTIPTAAWGA
ncbi:MAG: hypothetical protein ABTR92_18905, partial [Candidatus Accumulibacter phosphatis]